jgi:BirA family transcriptional regulator, biotin operon repressor / biotin---[acetyl-CoA-carboxylase] ligase
MNITIRTFGTLGSTNTEALERAREGAPEGLCIIARRQTAGRGRYGRTWASEKDAGLYFSIVLRPKLEMQFLPLITLMAGAAVHDMLQEYGLKPDIKWVNDILVDERKISGILAETAESAEGVAVVVGIGVNLTSGNFPPEIAATAASVESVTGKRISPEEMAQTLTKYLSYFYGILKESNGTAAIIDEWRKRSTYFAEKPVRALTGGETITGITDGLEANGALRIKQPDGIVAVIQAGDVERLRAEEVRAGASPPS